MIFSPLPFHLRHVYSLLHHFSELGKNKRSLFTFQLTGPVFYFMLCESETCHQPDSCLNCVELVWISHQLKAGLRCPVRGCAWQHLNSCINFMSCGQAFTVSDSPWKLCLWWFQTTDSPSFLIPFTPWHRRSICWTDNTQQRQVCTINYKIYQFVLREWKCRLT